MLHSLDFLFILLLLGIFDPTELINGIRQLYKTREGWLSPFPWCEEFQFFLGNIFTRLKVVRRKKTRGEISNVFVDMSSILDPSDPYDEENLVWEKPPIVKSTPTTGPLKSKHLRAAASQHSKRYCCWNIEKCIPMFGKPLMSNFFLEYEEFKQQLSFYWYWMDWMSDHPVNCRFFWINWRKSTPQMPHSCNSKTRNWKRGEKNVVTRCFRSKDSLKFRI